ncbi:MAG: energy transducer TonB [Balneolaceae bacterium]
MTDRKKPGANLKHYYSILLQTGLVITLIAFIVAVNLDLTGDGPDEYDLDEQDVLEIEEIIQTEHIETPPPPPRPPTPQEVPDDELIEDSDIQLDADLSLDGPMEVPPPPDDSDDEEEEDFFITVEDPPELIGGLEELQRSINYPEQAQRAGIEGRVIVQFIVNEEGEVEDPQILRGIGGGADEEAIRAVSEAQFVPGRQRGRPVRVQFSIPINFQLER